MSRKLSLALAVSAALSSTGAFALGLGEISTKSALNENFRADIRLVSVEPEEIDGVKVTLASSNDFSRRGLDRPYLLSKLRFKPMVLGDGRMVIRVSSREAVREPFLNFLIEVNWPKGRLLREFTVLLDPPVTERTLAQTTRSGAPLGAVQGGASRQMYAPLQQPPGVISTTSGDYGRVPRGGTAWSIASKMRFPGATTEQVVMALLRTNPEAFPGNNVNNLKAGSFLKMPTEEAVLSLSARDARQQFSYQSQGWGGYQDMPMPRLEIAATPGGEAPASDMDRVKTDLAMVRESGESTRQETQDLRSRIRELESQLGDIRKLLKLKSDQLAALQGGQTLPEAATVPGEPLPDETTPEAPVAGLPEEVAAGIAQVAEATETGMEPPLDVSPSEPGVEIGLAEGGEQAEVSMPEEGMPMEQPVAETTAPEIGTEAVQPPEQTQEQTQAQTQEQTQAQTTPDQPPPEQAQPPAPAPEPGLLDRVLGSPMMLGIGGAVALVLLALGWLLVKRRRESEDRFDESVLLAPGESTTVDLDAESEVAETVEHAEETSFISDFSPSDIDALQEETGEVDPSAEADVYIAYGRYQQAEGLINQAIEKNPDRLDLKQKLLEIYFTTRNTSAFTELAEQLHSDGAPDRDPEIWSRVKTMGGELVPGHELFGEESEPGGEQEDVAPESSTIPGDSEQLLVTDSEALASMDLDLDTELSELQEASQEISAFTNESVMEPPQPQEHTKGQEEDSEFAIDLSDLETLEDIDVGDLKMDSEEMAPTKLPEADSTQLGDQDTMFDESQFELSQFDIGEGELSDTLESEALSDVLKEKDSESEALSDVLKEESGESEALSDVFGDEGGFGEEEDIGTKLDLAGAYLEMGDSEGAREFLQEVLEEGDEQQKAKAKEMLEKIG